MITVINTNLLSAPGLIVHQCNCRTFYGKGLSKTLFDRYPSANIYADASIRRPGTIIVRGPIVNLLGQDNPGGPSLAETPQQRLIWFWSGLNELGRYMKNNKLTVVSFPYQIGCGLARGNWNDYFSLIQNFERAYQVNVLIHKI